MMTSVQANAELSNNQKAVVKDLLASIDDEDLFDVTLLSDEGIEVPACRFVLASRSKVLKRMLYGNFREATATKIDLGHYSARTLRAVVHYCCYNSININSDEGAHGLSATEDVIDEQSIRHLVNLAKAADYLEIPGLLRDAEQLVNRFVYERPLLACPVYDEADEQSALFETACRMIRCRPYVALDAALPPSDENGSRWYDSNEGGGGGGVDGGVECLRSDRIVDLMKDTEIEAGERFMFEMLKRWVDHATDYCHQKEEALQVARECGKYFRLHYIEPEELLSVVQKSGLFPPNLIVEAIMRQALKASQNRVWTIACRGKDTNVDRVLVEGCGNPEVNGVYYRIRGLHKGDVYSKHEVSCGQLLVYTLSCSRKDDMIESRIFGSKVLTHRAIRNMMLTSAEQEVVQTASPLPVFQPLLQVIHVELPSNNPHDASPLAKMCKIEVSDGDHYVSGTLAEELTTLVVDEQIQQFSLIKVLSCDKYEYDGKQHVHVTEVSFVSAHPGHRLGKPLDVNIARRVLLEDKEDDNDLESTPRRSTTSTMTSTTTATTRPATSEPGHKSDEASSDDGGLQKLYSCYYPRDQQAKDSKIPRTGWKIEEKGIEPPPRCTWIPATSRRFGDISNCSSFDNDDDDDNHHGEH